MFVRGSQDAPQFGLPGVLQRLGVVVFEVPDQIILVCSKNQPFEYRREKAELVTHLDSWKKVRRFIVERVRKESTKTAQLSFLAGDEYKYFFFVTNLDRSPKEGIALYDQRGPCENYIKEAKYDMAVGHLLLQSFWANEAVFQLMMMIYNLFLLFKMDRGMKAEYRQQIKTFRLKYIFLAGKIVRTARRVGMKLPKEYPYQEVFDMAWLDQYPHRHSSLFLLLSWLARNHLERPNL